MYNRRHVIAEYIILESGEARRERVTTGIERGGERTKQSN